MKTQENTQGNNRKIVKLGVDSVFWCLVCSTVSDERCHEVRMPIPVHRNLRVSTAQPYMFLKKIFRNDTTVR